MTSQVESYRTPIDGAGQSSRLYHELRTRIIRGDYPPGTRLRERELAEELHASRIPLREALPQLEADGFIETRPRRGAIVTQLTMQDVAEVYDVRLGVEVYATRLAAQQVASGARTSRLQQAMSTSRAAIATGNPTEIAETSAELHDEIVRLSGNALLISMMRLAAGRDRWIFRMTSGRDPNTACVEHEQLCDAIYTGNADLAASIAYAHIERGRIPTFTALERVLPPRRAGEEADSSTIRA